MRRERSLSSDGTVHSSQGVMTDPAQYALKPDERGWTVYNTKTGASVRLNDAPQVGLTRGVAEEIL